MTKNRTDPLSPIGQGNIVRCRLVLALLCVTLVGDPCAADTIHLNDGQRIDGTIVSEDNAAIIIETDSSGIMVRRKIARSAIQRIDRPVKEGPAYCVVPIIGAVGVEVTATAIEAGIQSAKQSGAVYVILAIDSPGGDVHEMGRILDLIENHRGELRFIAYVERAISAAAVIASACPDIFVTPRATIGGAVPYQIGPDGTPRAVEEKFQSIFRATVRSAAERGGHNPLIVQGMIDMKLVLSLARDPSGKPVVIEGDGGEPLKAADKILTLTADESVNSGLASGVVNSIDGIRDALAIAAWHKPDDKAWHATINRSRADVAQLQQDLARKVRYEAQNEYAKHVLPELERLRDRAEQLQSKWQAAKDELDDLKRRYDDELASLEQEKRQIINNGNGSNAARAVATQNYNTSAAKLAQRYEQLAQPLVTTMRETTREMEKIKSRGEELMAALEAE